MIAILFVFFIAMALALILTPLVKWLGVHIGAVDEPLERKIHTKPTPRIGGLAVLLSFVLALTASSFLPAPYSYHLDIGSRLPFALLGGLVIFCVGFFDDIRRLRPRFKLLFQIIAASLAYYGGLKIQIFSVGATTIHFGILSYFVTVFWFLLLINAMNLIDGLDGLAAGVALFACLIMIGLSIGRSDYRTAMEFAALAGVLLGFLRYNFNPASIFLGDGGSYFLGYTIAALSIHGSLKTGLATTLLIPLLALGVPIFDTLLSPVRRWLLGSRIFSPDKGHIHHHLLKIGLSYKWVVVLIYGITFLFCIAGIILVNIHNYMAGIFLIAMIIVFFIAVRKIGYLEYLAVDKFFGWLRDLSFEAGLYNERRSFLNIQLQVEQAQDMDTLWKSICLALEMMDFDRGELHLYNCAEDTPVEPAFTAVPAYYGMERRWKVRGYLESNVWTSRKKDDRGIIQTWTRGPYRRREDIEKNSIFRIELPLDADNSDLGKLIMIKDLSRENIQPYTLRRLGYLRNSIVTAMKKIKE
ncbi:MAG: undecaprenyl/decaprenyl-phosphate alpha-N-acetylglucosaminyl 1-phosphate transferase [Syntrophaceae bacterium]|nr:undecaprenyl/decaprenyl-phosphate alpha-N-acetylglucosaminyl 1-phosphate transferase [Syntrophaceae bacterium]